MGYPTEAHCHISFFIPMEIHQGEAVRNAVDLIASLEDPPNWDAGKSGGDLEFADAFPESEPPATAVQELALAIFRTVSQGAAKEPPDELHVMETNRAENGVFFFNDKDAWAPIEPTANMVRAIIEHFDLPAVTFQWGSFSPHATTNEFSGGAVFVAAGQTPEILDAGEWAQEKQSAAAQASDTPSAAM